MSEYFWTPPAFGGPDGPRPRQRVPLPTPITTPSRFEPRTLPVTPPPSQSSTPLRRQLTPELPPIVPLFGPRRSMLGARSPVHYLPKVKLFLDIHEPNSQLCAICFEPFSMLAIVTDLDCGHLMHHNCLCDWICRHNSCPVCREFVTPRFFPINT